MKLLITLHLLILSLWSTEYTDYFLKPGTADAPAEIPDIVQYKKNYLDLYQKQNLINNLYKKDILIKNELKHLNNISINKNILHRVLKNIDTVYIHQEFPTTLIYPDEFLILNAPTFPKGNILSAIDKNSIEILPTSKFTDGSITVRYIDDKDEQYTHKIFVKKYYQNNDKKSVLNTMIAYNNENLTDKQVMDAYYKLYNHYPTKTSLFKVNGVGYMLLKDNINGNYKINDIRFRIQRVSDE
jgi:hypothetical protein